MSESASFMNALTFISVEKKKRYSCVSPGPLPSVKVAVNLTQRSSSSTIEAFMGSWAENTKASLSVGIVSVITLFGGTVSTTPTNFLSFPA